VGAGAAEEVGDQQQGHQRRYPVLRPPFPARLRRRSEKLLDRRRPVHLASTGIVHRSVPSLMGRGRSVGVQPPPSAWLRRTKALARSAWTLTRALRAPSNWFSDVSRVWKSVRPAWYWLRARSAEFVAASSASSWIARRSPALSRSTAEVST